MIDSPIWVSEYWPLVMRFVYLCFLSFEMNKYINKYMYIYTYICMSCYKDIVTHCFHDYIYTLRTSCFCEIWVLCVSRNTYNHLYICIYLYIYIYIYGLKYIYIYVYIYTKLAVNAIVRLPHPRSGDSLSKETPQAPSADKQTRNYDIECSNHHLSPSTLRPKGLSCSKMKWWVINTNLPVNVIARLSHGAEIARASKTPHI